MAEAGSQTLSNTVTKLTEAVEWAVPWIVAMPPEMATSDALDAIRSFREAMLRCVLQAPGKSGTKVNKYDSLSGHQTLARSLTVSV